MKRDGEGEPAAIEARLLEAAGHPTMAGRDLAELRRLMHYHLGEYQLQRSHVTAAGVLARMGLVRGRVLDVGCGLGQLLLTTGQDGNADLLAGVDIDRDMLRCGAELARLEPPRAASPTLLAADALRLPFRDRTFDLVACRLLLMSLPVGPAVHELARVLRPGGFLYLHLTGWGFYVGELGRGHLAGALFGLANGALLHFTGHQMHLRGLWNNYETRRRIVRLLEREGLLVEGDVTMPRRHRLALNRKILACRPAPAA